jgi:cytoskeletal protein RodZ
MALSMDEQRMLAEIERRLADDDPVLAARLTTFRLPRLTLATRSARSRLMTSVLMLVVVGVVAVFVYALMPFHGQAARMGTAQTTATHSVSSKRSVSSKHSVSSTRPALSAAKAKSATAARARPAGSAARTSAQRHGPAPGRSAPSSAYGK